VNVNEVKSTIRNGNEAAKQAKATLEQAASEAAATERLARLTIHNSVDDDAQGALKILEGLGREVELTIRRIDAAVDHADTYVSALG
jgi:hypothetical protein